MPESSNNLRSIYLLNIESLDEGKCNQIVDYSTYCHEDGNSYQYLSVKIINGGL